MKHLYTTRTHVLRITELYDLARSVGDSATAMAQRAASLDASDADVDLAYRWAARAGYWGRAWFAEGGR